MAAQLMGRGAAGVGLCIHQEGNPTAPSKEKEQKQTWFPALSRHVLSGRWAAGWQQLGRRGSPLCQPSGRGHGCQRSPRAIWAPPA